MDSIIDTFAHNLRSLRKDRGWTQDQLAQASELSVNTIVNLERGLSEDDSHEKRWPSYPSVMRLALALGAPETRLFMPVKIQPQPTLKEALSKIADEFGYEVVIPKRKRKKA